MRKATAQALLALPPILALALAMAWAGGQGGQRAGGWPVFAWCGAFCFVLNGLVFLPSYAARSERYFDLTGSLTYLGAVAGALALGARDARALLLSLLVAVWALRLGSFLFQRIRHDGVDRRFDVLKVDFARFLLTWTLQGLWVFLTLAAALAAMTTQSPAPLGPLAVLGSLLWLVGFGIEVVADRQKSRFRADPANRDRFIHTGLWAWSRHPNYCGEILLWAGVALIALRPLQGWQLVTLVSPLFVYLLLTRISGIPLLESRADAKWGGDPDYEAYKARTPVLWLRPPG